MAVHIVHGNFAETVKLVTEFVHRRKVNVLCCFDCLKLHLNFSEKKQLVVRTLGLGETVVISSISSELVLATVFSASLSIRIAEQSAIGIEHSSFPSDCAHV